MIAAVSVVRDEEDIIRDTVGNMLQQVDRVYVADNGSIDGTRDALESLEGDLVVADDTDTAHYHGRKITELAEQARQEGAEWIVPFDADEFWIARGHDRIADALATVDPAIAICDAELYDHRSTARDDLSHRGVRRMQWRSRHPLPLPKVAFRPVQGAEVHMGNHGVTFPSRAVPLRLGGLLTVRHFPYRSPTQFIRKVRQGAAAMRETNLSEDSCAHWRAYDRLSDEQLREVFFKFFFRTKPEKELRIDDETQPPLVKDPVRLSVPVL